MEGRYPGYDGRFPRGRRQWRLTPRSGEEFQGGGIGKKQEIDFTGHLKQAYRTLFGDRSKLTFYETICAMHLEGLKYLFETGWPREAKDPDKYKQFSKYAAQAVRIVSLRARLYATLGRLPEQVIPPLRFGNMVTASRRSLADLEDLKKEGCIGGGLAGFISDEMKTHLAFVEKHRKSLIDKTAEEHVSHILQHLDTINNMRLDLVLPTRTEYRRFLKLCIGLIVAVGKVAREIHSK